MTTDVERTRHLIQAGAFLRALSVLPDLPEAVRAEAQYLLRHYPNAGEVQQMAKLQASSRFGVLEPALADTFDPAWLDNYAERLRAR